MYKCLHVTYCYSRQILIKFEVSWNTLNKILKNIKLYENPAIGSRVILRGRTDRHGNFADPPKNSGGRMATEFKPLGFPFFTVYEDFKYPDPL